MLFDSEQRDTATDPSRSYLVQAPAGSGKTEILTQRFLRLLSVVKAPEEVVALTFTRKAASEMRERVIHALKAAKEGVVPKNAHQQKTLLFAKEALAKDTQYNWHLLLQPNRLKIGTIDSLCQSINQSIPLLEQQVVGADITDKADYYYLKAAKDCIDYAINTPLYQNAMTTLLLHVDNKQQQLIQLFQSLLRNRDQWLSVLLQAKIQEKQEFEHALCLIEQHELDRFKKSLPATLAAELVALSKTFATLDATPNSLRSPLKSWEDFQASDSSIASALSALVLDSKNEIRQAIDHHVGFKSDSCPKETYKQLKEQGKSLLASLSKYPDFLCALLKVSSLPSTTYDAAQWETLSALFELLPLLVSHLHLLWQEDMAVDFTSISQQALLALGNDDTPTDLALYLDNAISHLLIDEFQDTSLTQFQLIEKLVQGWFAEDGKTLFLVGDPMQSIYRFRQAEVGLFFRAKTEGIGPVTFQFLQLHCNFRSTPTIVEWINSQFSKIFPNDIDIESGAVSFASSMPVMTNSAESFIQAHECNSKEDEACRLVELIQEELVLRPSQSIAILVRSRTQLMPILNALRHTNIPYQGTDINLLSNLPSIRDVWSLTLALLNPANRLSWLSVLRSPFCGLDLLDLHKIAQFDKNESIYANLLKLDDIQGISDEGVIRAKYFIQTMHDAFMHRGQYALSEWVHQTAKQLHLESILTSTQQDELMQFWNLLDHFEQDARLPQMNIFLQELNKLYAIESTPATVQIMTIHKSKGLEFDTVFLPALSTQPARKEKPLLRWLNLPRQAKAPLFLLSPVKAAHIEHCPLYDYLDAIDDEKSHYETQRLLYVAATRAKSRLYLLDNKSKGNKKSFRHMLCTQTFTNNNDESITTSDTKLLPTLHKLSLDLYTNSQKPTTSPLNPPSTLHATDGRLIGVITHRLLQWICDKHPKTVHEVPWQLATSELASLGFETEQMHTAIDSIKAQITKLYEDPIGQWIIDTHHNEHNEYELLVEHNNQVVTRIIDRTFEDENSLWIIDFKTGKDDDSSLKQHQQQMSQYAGYLSQKTHLPIHCGLYYLASGHWAPWPNL
jgi:ATP-dependent exoDNAse (exonuclease V) beta subunit